MNTKNMIKYMKFLPFINNSQRIIGEKWLLENGRCIYKKGFNNFCCIFDLKLKVERIRMSFE
ncbi:hypothetical protein COE35_18450 [Priestia megaterium]|nr:hypothetical protein COE35_18450 [Priestia megaterium]